MNGAPANTTQRDAVMTDRLLGKTGAVVACAALTAPTFTGDLVGDVTGDITMTGGGSTLDYYEEGTLVTAGTGARVDAVTVRYTRIGNVVTVTIPRFIVTTVAAAAATIVLAAALPATVRPLAYHAKLIPVMENAVWATGSLTVTAAGVVTIGSDAVVTDGAAAALQTAFTNGAACGTEEVSVQYVIA